MNVAWGLTKKAIEELKEKMRAFLTLFPIHFSVFFKIPVSIFRIEDGRESLTKLAVILSHSNTKRFVSIAWNCNVNPLNIFTWTAWNAVGQHTPIITASQSWTLGLSRWFPKNSYWGIAGFLCISFFWPPYYCFYFFPFAFMALKKT